MQINGAKGNPSEYFWRPATEGDNSLGWVVFTGVKGWADATVNTLEAGATALDGSAISARADFLRESGDAVKSEADRVQIVPYLPDGEDTGLFKEGLGVLFQAAPEEVYDSPELITIPVPDYVHAGALTLYYLGNGEDGPAWYPAERVPGLLAAPVAVSGDGASVEAWLNHGGTLRLGYAPARDTAAAIPVGYGALVVMAATSLIMWALGLRRREAR